MLIPAPVYFSATTILGGAVTFAYRVPGTYGGLIPNDPTAGRYLERIEVWCDSAANGDKLTDLKLIDTDGVLSAPEQSVCPFYPDVVRFYDTGTLPAGMSTGMFIHDNPPAVIRPFNTDASPQLKLLPAGLYLTGTFTAGDAAISKVFRCNIFWGRWVNSPV